jgi:hypothetical protein
MDTHAGTERLYIYICTCLLDRYIIRYAHIYIYIYMVSYLHYIYICICICMYVCVDVVLQIMIPVANNILLTGCYLMTVCAMTQRFVPN